MPEMPMSSETAVFGLLAHAGRKDPPRLLFTSILHTPSGKGEKRGGIGVRKLLGQNQDKKYIH